MTIMTMTMTIRRLTMILFITTVAAGWGEPPIVWVDKNSGIAIGGYDPVAYLTHQRPVKGEHTYEHYWEGATWRFYNEGNLAQFVRHPEIYAPQFAGYDMLSLSKGLFVKGLPSVWARYEGQLYLFQSEQTRAEWRRQPGDIITRLEKTWPELSQKLQDFRAPEPILSIYPERK